VDDTIEQEANEFAGEFLVPLRILKERYRYEKKMENLAAEFDVSRDVIVISLMKHHLIR